MEALKEWDARRDGAAYVVCRGAAGRALPFRPWGSGRICTFGVARQRTYSPIPALSGIPTRVNPSIVSKSSIANEKLSLVAGVTSRGKMQRVVLRPKPACFGLDLLSGLHSIASALPLL
jgi:hypothetical protein